MASLGQRLRWVREVLDMTQEQMATAVGVDQTAWSLYELGKRWPDLAMAMRIAAKFLALLAAVLALAVPAGARVQEGSLCWSPDIEFPVPCDEDDE